MPRLDTDHRFRSSYAPYADTGRLRSSRNPHKTGGNAQNIDREARMIYKPDPGCVFLGVDVSQGESRITYAYTGSERLLRRARALPGAIDEVTGLPFDDHKKAATIAFRKTWDAVTKQERYIGKRARHGGNYGMSGAKLSEELLKEGLTFTADECAVMMQRIIDEDTPEVREYQRWVRQTVLMTQGLRNSWGRKIDFTYERYNEDLYRRSYAWIPQSELSDWVIQWALKPLHKSIEFYKVSGKKPPWPAINQDGHDSLLVSVPPEEVWNVARFLQKSMERPRRLTNGVELTMWLEFSIGLSYDFEGDGEKGRSKEWKRLPGRDEMLDEAMRLWRVQSEAMA